MIEIDEISSDEMAEELKKRGYTVWPDFDIDNAIHELELRGFHINNENNFDNFLTDFYYDVVLLTPEQTRQALNKLFIKHIEKWM